MTDRPGFVRRALGAAAAAGLGLLLIAPHAVGETRTVDDGPWEGSRLDTPSRVSTGTHPLEATIASPSPVNLRVSAEVSKPGGLHRDCLFQPGEDVASSGDNYWLDLEVDCNGAYPYTFNASAFRLSGTSHMPELSGTLIVEIPPAAVRGVSATVVEGTRNVSIKWKASSGTALDFLGYQVQRRHKSGDWVKVTDVGSTATSFVDSKVPADSGDYTYRVVGRRTGVGDDVLSAGGDTDEVELPEAAPDPSTTVPGDGTGPSVPGGTDPGGTDGTDGAAVVPGGDGTSTTGKPNVIKGSARPRTTTRAPNLGAPAQSNLGILLSRPSGLADEDDVDGDGGYNDALPFGDPSIDGSLADEEEAGSSIFYSGERRGLAVPVAVGFVFFAWAIHLRFLARASRPEPLPAGGSQYAVDPFDPFYDPML